VQPPTAPEAIGDAEVLQIATRVLAGIALRGLALSARPMPLRQFQLLSVLEEMGRTSTEQAARALRLSLPSVTRLVDRLVASGYLARGTHPYNRSVVTLELTSSGRDLVARVMHWRHQELARILHKLGSPERRAAIEAIRTFVHAASGTGYGIDHLISGRPD